MELIYFILIAYGMTYILVYGSIFSSVRPSCGKLGELLHCPLCTGFWVGVFLWSINNFTELFTFEYNLINGFLLGCLSAGTSYFLSTILDDFGIKIKINKTQGGNEYEAS
tara:strand:- start:1603 stop:1932 length:330 start_codon:yes stop_codon:yes gene_type:complete